MENKVDNQIELSLEKIRVTINDAKSNTDITFPELQSFLFDCAFQEISLVSAVNTFNEQELGQFVNMFVIRVSDLANQII